MYGLRAPGASASTIPEPASGRGRQDLTARARIRDAAVRLFTEQGAERTTIRDVAREAGVSGGLVQHHFGTKEALRNACDEHVLAELIRIKAETVLAGKVDNPAFLADAHPEILGLQRYLARSLIDGSPAAAAMFDQMVTTTEEWLTTHRAGVLDDAHGYAVLMVAMESGLLAMYERLSAALGSDVLEEVGHLRLARAKIEFYSTPLIDPELAQRMRRGIDALTAGRGADDVDDTGGAGDTRDTEGAGQTGDVRDHDRDERVGGGMVEEGMKT